MTMEVKTQGCITMRIKKVCKINYKFVVAIVSKLVEDNDRREFCRLYSIRIFQDSVKDMSLRILEFNFFDRHSYTFTGQQSPTR